MENKIDKREIKNKILEIFEIENRNINIREITQILKMKYKIMRSAPMIKKYLKEMVKDGEIQEE